MVPFSARPFTTRCETCVCVMFMSPFSVTPSRKLALLKAVGRKSPLTFMTPLMVTPACSMRLPVPADNCDPALPT